MYQKDDYNSEEFRAELKKCTLFQLKYPRGGHYNDGYELLGKLRFDDSKALLEGLNSIGAEYLLHKEKPESWTPPPFHLEGHQYWIEYNSFFECFGYKTHICIGTNSSDFSIEFNLRTTSWYDVLIEDVKRVVAFEKVLISRGLLSTIKA